MRCDSRDQCEVTRDAERGVADLYREIVLNFLGLSALVVTLLFGSYALKLDAKPIASTSVGAFATADGTEYPASEGRYDYPRVRKNGGSGGNGNFHTSLAAQQR